MLRDHPVPFRREEYIADVAEQLCRMAGNQYLPYFNIVTFVEEFLLKVHFRNEKLKIEFYEAPEGSDDLAFVSFRPLTLHVDSEIWDLAREGEPKARFIIAHEIGHIILHEHDAQHFSNDPDLQIQYRTQEHSAEWQANTFASYFLISRRMMVAFETKADLAASTSVNEPFVLARHSVEKRVAVRRVEVNGRVCEHCGNFTKMSDGICRSKACSA